MSARDECKYKGIRRKMKKKKKRKVIQWSERYSIRERMREDIPYSDYIEIPIPEE